MPTSGRREVDAARNALILARGPPEQSKPVSRSIVRCGTVVILQLPNEYRNPAKRNEARPSWALMAQLATRVSAASSAMPIDQAPRPKSYRPTRRLPRPLASTFARLLRVLRRSSLSGRRRSCDGIACQQVFQECIDSMCIIQRDAFKFRKICQVGKVRRRNITPRANFSQIHCDIGFFGKSQQHARIWTENSVPFPRPDVCELPLGSLSPRRVWVNSAPARNKCEQRRREDEHEGSKAMKHVSETPTTFPDRL